MQKQTDQEIFEELSKNIDPTLCFVCQENTPTHRMQKMGNWVPLCHRCTTYVQTVVDCNNRIKQALSASDKRHIFQYVLGWNPLPTILVIEKITGEKKHDNTN